MDRRLERLLPVERWPTRDEAARSRWFSPVALGRTVVAETAHVGAGDGAVARDR